MAPCFRTPGYHPDSGDPGERYRAVPVPIDESAPTLPPDQTLLVAGMASTVSEDGDTPHDPVPESVKPAGSTLESEDHSGDREATLTRSSTNGDRHPTVPRVELPLTARTQDVDPSSRHDDAAVGGACAISCLAICMSGDLDPGLAH